MDRPVGRRHRDARPPRRRRPAPALHGGRSHLGHRRVDGRARAAAHPAALGAGLRVGRGVLAVPRDGARPPHRPAQPRGLQEPRDHASGDPPRDPACPRQPRLLRPERRRPHHHPARARPGRGRPLPGGLRDRCRRDPAAHLHERRLDPALRLAPQRQGPVRARHEVARRALPAAGAHRPGRHPHRAAGPADPGAGVVPPRRPRRRGAARGARGVPGRGLGGRRAPPRHRPPRQDRRRHRRRRGARQRRHQPAPRPAARHRRGRHRHAPVVCPAVVPAAAVPARPLALARRPEASRRHDRRDRGGRRGLDPAAPVDALEHRPRRLRLRLPALVLPAAPRRAARRRRRTPRGGRADRRGRAARDVRREPGRHIR